MYKEVFKILVADDYPEHIKLITNILLADSQKYQVLAASNGKNALEIALSDLPDLIIMDWDMPVMNGLEATIGLKSDESTREIPIIIASGYHTDSHAIMEALENGAIDFVRKPIDKIELLARVHSMLRLVLSHREILKQKEINFNQQLNFKIGQLSAQALSIARQNEHLQLINEEIKNLLNFCNSQGKKLIYTLIEKTNKEIKQNGWEDFEQQFNIIYIDFSTSLNLKHPDLTTAERKLCSLLRLNLTSKEIANLIFQEPSSVDVARYRLRQKLGLEKDENLITYLSGLG
ncbi:MAG: response regulator [Bacteroidales bacterium]